MVWGIDYDEREEAIVKGLVEHLEEAAPVAGLHGFIEFILFELLLNSDKIEHKAARIHRIIDIYLTVGRVLIA